MPQKTPSSETGEYCLKYQSRAVAALASICNSLKVPTALLLSGPAGTGKRSAAERFAQTLNCRSPQGPNRKNTRKAEAVPLLQPCGECLPCRKMEAGMHPDIRIIQPEKAAIRIAPIRELYPATASPPHSAAHRMILIQDAHTLNPEASNALLKLLEEPPAGTYFILTATAPERLLDTIRSRCRHIRFQPLGRPQMMEYLLQRYCLEPEPAALAADIAQGSPALARRLITPGKDDITWLDRRRRLMELTGFLVNPAVSPSQKVIRALTAAHTLSSETTGLPIVLTLIRTWIRDLQVLSFSPDNVINQDCLNPLRELARAIDSGRIPQWLSSLNQTGRRIEGNADPRLALESFLLSLIHPMTAPA